MVYQKQVVNTMYNRAKYHPKQTNNMREAMKIFSIWLKNKNYKSTNINLIWDIVIISAIYHYHMIT